MKDVQEGFGMLKKIMNCMGYLLSFSRDLNNSNNCLMQINSLKRFNLDKLEKMK